MPLTKQMLFGKVIAANCVLQKQLNFSMEYSDNQITMLLDIVFTVYQPDLRCELVLM